MNSNFKREFMNGKKDISRSAFGALLALVLAPGSAVTQQPIFLINNSSSQFTTCAGTQIPAIASADYTINDNSLITYTSTLLQNNQALATGSETFNCSQTPCYEYYAYGDALTVQNGLSTYQVQLTVTDQSNNILYAGDSNLVDVRGRLRGRYRRSTVARRTMFPYARPARSSWMDRPAAATAITFCLSSSPIAFGAETGRKGRMADAFRLLQLWPDQ